MLVKINPHDRGIMIDLRYATANNVTGKVIYDHADCYLLDEAALLFQRALELARPHGLTFKIFDAYRPSEGQWALWNHSPDPNFVADPRRGSAHTRGVAIDLTLVDRESGEELEMGTPFDDFTPLSFHGNMEISLEAQRNRFLLLGIMSAAGWDFYKNEWWHYQLFNARQYDLIEQSVLERPMIKKTIVANNQ